MRPPLDRPIALIGLMGAGKTSVARALGERLGVAVADLDSMLEAEEGCTVADLFERAGEDYFRRRESELLALALGAGVRVLACGGGVVLDPAHRALLEERCRVVWLEVSPPEAARRVSAEPGRRPRSGSNSCSSSAGRSMPRRRKSASRPTAGAPSRWPRR